MRKRTLRVSEIQTSLPMVELTTGREVQLHAVTGECVEMQQEYLRSKDPTLLWRVAAKLLPDALPEEISKLTIAQCEAILTEAAKHLRRGVTGVSRSDSRSLFHINRARKIEDGH